MTTGKKIISIITVIIVIILAAVLYYRYFFVFGEGVKAGELNYVLMLRKNNLKTMILPAVLLITLIVEKRIEFKRQ